VPRARQPRNEPIAIGGTTVGPGQRTLVEVPVSRLPTATSLTLPIVVAHGLRPGPKLWLSAVVHGDELNGMEIIRRVLEAVRPRQMAGTVVAAPIVNVFGVLGESRYLPDRRDLNRSFPGSANGSLGSQLAHLFMTNVVEACDMGIDLHTGSDHRYNYPQIRGDLEDPATRELAEAFGAPVSIHSPLRDGSLREACRRRGIPVIVYEGGEANRFNEEVIVAGTDGIMRVLAHLGMRPAANGSGNANGNGGRRRPATTFVCHTHLVRARRTGILRTSVNAGQRVARGETLGIIADAVGGARVTMKAPIAGVVIGHTRRPLVHRGDALFHLADLDPAAKGTAARLPRRD
jgi:predicted deacylase